MTYKKVISDSEDSATYHITGDLDFNLIMHLKPDILALPKTIKTLYLNLSATNYMDSSGLGLIIFCKEQYENNNGKVILQSPTGDVMRVLELSNVHRIMEIRSE